MSILPGPGDLGRNGPEIPTSIFDNLEDVEMALDDAGIPDYLASILAEVAYRGWRDEDAADLMRDLRRHVQPIIDEAEQQACADMDEAA